METYCVKEKEKNCMRRTKWVYDNKKWAKNVLVYLRFLRNQKNTIC